MKKICVVPFLVLGFFILFALSQDDLISSSGPGQFKMQGANRPGTNDQNCVARTYVTFFLGIHT